MHFKSCGTYRFLLELKVFSIFQLGEGQKIFLVISSFHLFYMVASKNNKCGCRSANFSYIFVANGKESRHKILIDYDFDVTLASEFS